MGKDAVVNVGPGILYGALGERLRQIARELAFEFDDMPFTQAQIDQICEQHPELDDLPWPELKWWLTVHYQSLRN